MSIPNHVLDQLCSQADLVSIIGKHTTLKRAGREFKGCCPFHGEKTPSFYVNPQKNVYNCFGCGVSGNAISFLRDYENLTFSEAVKELSQQTGIEIPEDDRQEVHYQRRPASHNHTASIPPQPNQQVASTAAADSSQVNTNAPFNNSLNENVPIEAYYGQLPSSSPDIPENSWYDANAMLPPDNANDYPQDPQYPQSYGLDYPAFSADAIYAPEYSAQYSAEPINIQTDGNLYELLERIQAFYQNNLYTHTPALAYFKSRGLTEQTLKTFGLGYAPAGWQHLEQHFAADIEGLRVLGLVRTSEKGREYDLLRDRVIFPIRDNQGRVIGFAGRALDNEVKPKYINSSDSPVFHKQHVLYGYFESRQQRANDWLVVEGYMDVIALYQAGIYGAVASMGTAVNENQISRLLQLNPTLTLCFDGDAAGQKAAWRTLEVSLPILSDDKELRFLSLPSKYDPDTFIQAHGTEAMQAQIHSAIPLSQYVFAYLSERYDLSLAEGKAKLMAQVRTLTSQLPKGSSFRYLLNNDIYQRLGGRRNQKTAAHDALLDFDSDMTASVQLELCLLFDPSQLMEDPIQRIWQNSGVNQIPQPTSTLTNHHNNNQTPVNLPQLPSWQALDNGRLAQLTAMIKQLMPFLPKDTNAAAHFILANLPAGYQQQLAQRWQGFFDSLTQRGIIDVDDLIEDLLVQLLLQALSKQLTDAKNVITLSHINRQRQTLITWLKKQHAEQVNKMSTVNSK
ncbi:DNA primase [Psychrobacter sp. I-STPA6b]|uniref:DNA primase n=1 Tax=Psychrobacter sp. I-STPA6b TaxID=2585718 RepID=UPI001D0C14A7|nr:CHC2 zinc finger domain-containing protein [Psychrobacter sp. I-STPA6b]